MVYYDLPETLNVKGSYSTYSALVTAQPTGTYGHVYVVAGTYYTWSRDTLSWASIPNQAIENKLVNLALSKLPQPHLTGLKLKSDIVLGDLILNTIDSNGVVWVVNDLNGWWSLPEVETQDLPRGWGDGSYDAKGRFANRLITLTGSFLTQSPDQAVAARDALFRAIDLVYQGGWLIVRENPDKYAWVRLSGTPEIQNVSARGRTDFSIGLKAVDPIKYELVGNDVDSLNSTTIAMGGSATITNSGNTRVPVLFEVDGALTASASSPVAITLTSATPDKVINIVLSQSQTADTLSIDTYKREVLFNGQGYETGQGSSRRRVSTLVDWFDLEPGANTITFTGTGNATCTVLFRSGWIG
jgi:hypothetical protein